MEDPWIFEISTSMCKAVVNRNHLVLGHIGRRYEVQFLTSAYRIGDANEH
jgi:hypothetical protein